MKYEVRIDMKNDNTLYTISMLSALLEHQSGDYYDLLTPFVLYSLPSIVHTEIVVDAITQSMKDFGFIDFPHKLCEKILQRLCCQTSDEHTYVRYKIISGGKKKFYVNEIYDRSSFDNSKGDMRRKIDGILSAIQKYFEENFYHKTIPTNEIREKLIRFFESNGFTVIQSVSDLRLIAKDDSSASFEIAHFILSEHEKKSVIYDDLCEVTKGFLTYKGLYYFLDDKKNHIDSKFQDVTFYLDCSLVLDVLNYDTASDYNAITELIRLIRRCGGKVAVFRHTTEEAARLIDTFAAKPHARNGFRLDNLSVQNLPHELLSAIAKDIPKTLKDKAQLDTIDAPSFADPANYRHMLGEQDIITWLTENRQCHANSFDTQERYRYDAKSLISIGLCRRDFHPHYIEQARAIIITQDPWLNKCLRELYYEKFKTEVYYAITDTELVSLLWLQDHKLTPNLPSDILIANAHAACRVSSEVMERAIEIATAMETSGTIPSDAALLVSSHTEFKPFIAKRVRNNATMLSDDVIRAAVDEYINTKASQKVEEVRTRVQQQAQHALSLQEETHSAETTAMQHELFARDNTIAQLKEQLIDQDKHHRLSETAAKKKRCDHAERVAKKIAKITRGVLCTTAMIIALSLVIVFAIHCYNAYVSGKSWLPYALIDIFSFVSIPAFFISKKSFLHKGIRKMGDWAYTKVYSIIISEE